jgi:hypothetical protein
MRTRRWVPVLRADVSMGRVVDGPVCVTGPREWRKEEPLTAKMAQLREHEEEQGNGGTRGEARKRWRWMRLR